MNKEELKKEALTKYKTGSYPQLHPDHFAFIHGYLAGAEPREKRIAELENLIHAERKRQEQCDDIHLRTIAELEKENAELKEISVMQSDFAMQLDKAKYLIKNLIRVTWGEGWNYDLGWKVEAEEFLKEVSE